MTDDLDPQWTALAELGRLTGHVVCRCSDPACGLLQMARYRPASQPWPVCVNHPGSLSANRLTGFPRVAPVMDPQLTLNKRPGEPRTDKQLLAAGLIRRPAAANHRSTMTHATPTAADPPPGRLLTGSCEDDCQTACAYPGQFSECALGALDNQATTNDSQASAGRATNHDHSTGTDPDD